MLKKSYWIIGLVIVIVLGAFIYWKFGYPGSPKFGAKAGDECAKAKYPFACRLDKAMAAQDLNLCAVAGSERVNCLKAYAEIQEIELDCSKLQDVGFREECKSSLAKQNSQQAGKETPAASTTPRAIPTTTKP